MSRDSHVVVNYSLNSFKRMQHAHERLTPRGRKLRDLPCQQAGDQCFKLLQQALHIGADDVNLWPASFLLVRYALPEVIKNAYDARATSISLVADADTGQLDIVDNGRGFGKDFPLSVDFEEQDYAELSRDGRRIESSKSDDDTKLGGAGAGLAMLQLMMQQTSGSLHISNEMGVGCCLMSVVAGAKLTLRSEQRLTVEQADTLHTTAMKQLDRSSSSKHGIGRMPSMSSLGSRSPFALKPLDLGSMKKHKAEGGGVEELSLTPH